MLASANHEPGCRRPTRVRGQDSLALVRYLLEDKLSQLAGQGNLSGLFRSPDLRYLKPLDLRYNFESKTQIDELLCNE